MTTRTTAAVATFRHPFQLEKDGDVLPAGSYTVDTEEEQLDTVSFVAWKRVSTTMRVRRDGAIETVTIDPNHLLAALARDAAQG